MLNSGDVLNNRYRVERVLGRGGMGGIYLATHLQLEEKVAIKEMLQQSPDSPNRAAIEQQFRSEARILNRLRHPNLPRVYDFFEIDGHHYLVMDYIKGGTLEAVQAKGGLTESQALDWTRSLCEVLGYLHSQNPPVIFRDLKPGNIMLDGDGTIRLIDFGIAKVFDAEQGASTKTVLRGAASHGFSAPEQYGVGGTDARSDIYSLGATLYALLSQRVPPPSMEVAAGIASVVPLKEYRHDLSDMLLSAIEWMMQTHRDMRPPDMAAVMEALGFTTAEVVKASLPAQMRRVLREEFHHFFPLNDWIDRASVRKHALARLASESETAPMLAVVGEPGLGKSRLLEEIAEHARDRYEVLAIGHGSPAVRQQPFGLILPVISDWMRANNDVRQVLQDRLETQELHEAALVLPEVKALLKAGEAPALRGPLERARSVMSALTIIFEDAARDAPVLLLLDDMQFTDEATLRLLDTLRIGPLTGKVAIVLAVDSPSPEHACKEFIERWSRKGELVPLTLPPLQREDVLAYVAAALPPVEGLDRSVDLLLERSHGNPLLLEELLRFMVVRRYIAEKNGILAVTEFRGDILPNTLEDAVRRRREALPLDTQALLGQASVAGVRFDLRTVLKLTGESTAALTEALQRACETLFVVPDERGMYRFTSDAARQVFYQGLSPAQRASLHRKLGTMEEERATRTGEVTHTAWHYEQAGDVDKSLEFITRLSQDFLSPKTLEVVVGDAMRFKEFKGTNQLSAEETEQGLLALNMLLRSMRSLSIYGSNSPVTQTSFGTALNVITNLVTERGTLGYTLSEDNFYVNQTQVPMGQVPPEFKATLARHRMSGFEFQPGMDEQQLRDFLDLLISTRDTVQAAGGWTAACRARHVSHIVINEIVYIGVAEKELFDPSKLKLVEEVVVKQAPSEKWTADHPAPARTGLDGIDAVLASMAASSGSNDVLLEHLQKLRQMLEEMKKPEKPAAPERTGPTIEADLVTSLTDLLRQARSDELRRLVNLIQVVDVPLKTFLESRPELLLAGLEHPEPDRRTISAMGLMKMGKDARRWLIHYLKNTDHAVGRAAAAYLFARSEAEPSVLLAQEVLGCSTAEESGRLLKAMQVADMQWAAPLTNLLFSPVAEFRRAALRILVESNIPSYTKLELLTPTLQCENLAIIEDTVRTMGEVGDPKAVPQLAVLMEKLFARKTPDVVRVEEQVCYAMGRIGSDAALPMLRAVIVRKGFLVGSWDSTVRAAAVYALGRLPGQEATELLNKQLTDSDANVSGTAKLVLSRKRQPQAEAGDRHDLLEVFGSEGLAVLEREFTTAENVSREAL